MISPDKRATISLSTPISSNDNKQSWESVDLQEPTLLQVKQFYDEQTKGGALSAMGLLITLVSGIPRDVVNKLVFTDYKLCEAYLLVFLNYSPETGESS